MTCRQTTLVVTDTVLLVLGTISGEVVMAFNNIN